jgi:hypothetical protein
VYLVRIKRRNLLQESMELKVENIILSVVLCGCETFFSQIEGETYAEGVREYGAKEDIWS